MNWFTEILMNSESVAHIVLLYAAVISIGVLLGKTKIAGVSLGVTFVLFAGIIAGHILHQYNIIESSLVFNCFQDFGLILFVFSIGLQVGPSFFTSFREGGVRMNLIAAGIVLLNIAVMFGIYYSFCDTADPQSLPMMVGVLCGAVTNTPGLGAANAALEQIGADGLGATLPNIANGYACAYPLGVVGIIFSIILVKYFFRIDLRKEEENHNKEISQNNLQPHLLNIEITNASLDNKTILELCRLLNRNFVCSRCLHEGHVQLPNKDTKIYLGDKMFIVCAEEDAEAITTLIGKPADIDWEHQDFPRVAVFHKFDEVIDPTPIHIDARQSALSPIDGEILTIADMEFWSKVNTPKEIATDNMIGYYWTSTHYDKQTAMVYSFFSDWGGYIAPTKRNIRASVRLVHDIDTQ